jgi:hypothetical protein
MYLNERNNCNRSIDVLSHDRGHPRLQHLRALVAAQQGLLGRAETATAYSSGRGSSTESTPPASAKGCRPIALVLAMQAGFAVGCAIDHQYVSRPVYIAMGVC